MLVSSSAAATLFSTSFLLPIVRKSDANNETVQIIQVDIFACNIADDWLYVCSGNFCKDKRTRLVYYVEKGIS